MWKNIDDHLIHVTDPKRIRFKTYISKHQLEELYNLAKLHDTHISYLLENGLKNIMSDYEFTFSKKNRLKDKVEFRTTSDSDILKKAKTFAKHHKVNFTDIIQASIDYIDLSEVKKRDWRYRIE